MKRRFAIRWSRHNEVRAKLCLACFWHTWHQFNYRLPWTCHRQFQRINPLPSLTLQSAWDLNVPSRPKRSRALLLSYTFKCPLKKTQSFCPCSRALNRSGKGLKPFLDIYCLYSLHIICSFFTFAKIHSPSYLILYKGTNILPHTTRRDQKCGCTEQHINSCFTKL
jgi:hypothetical protein